MLEHCAHTPAVVAEGDTGAAGAGGGEWPVATANARLLRARNWCGKTLRSVEANGILAIL